MERGLEADKELAAMWEGIKRSSRLEVSDQARVSRRRLSQERNFREGWKFNWSDARSQFYSVFDAL